MIKRIVFTQIMAILSMSSIHAQHDWSTYSNENYTIQYPEDWQVEASGLMGTKFVLFSPLEDENDLFRENANYISQDLNGMELSLDDYVEQSMAQIGQFILNGEIISNEKHEDELTYFLINYTGDQGIFHLNFTQKVWIGGGFTHILTFTCEQDKYDKFIDSGFMVLESFVLR